MHFDKEILPGTWLLNLKRFEDARGSFVKTYARSVFDAALGRAGADGPAFDMREEFYSLSNKDVVRGMHFQLPPHDHIKLVYCAAGAVQDVLLDLRKGPNYGRSVTVRLDADTPQLLFIPKGIAHGFLSLCDGSLMVYKTSTEHAPSHDAGVRFDSFGHDWNCNAPILSARDQNHPTLIDLVSPF
jgi:dTDP-4-dehydrorhamnose 3,5-epimerase/CDP-3, 6-dideoxy-D-glycero-D-glycero-4-hexulose-5-epimerase